LLRARPAAVTPPAGAGSTSPSNVAEAEAAQLSQMFYRSRKKIKTKQTRDNCISVHFLKEDAKKQNSKAFLPPPLLTKSVLL